LSEKSAKKSVRYYSDITSCDVDWFWYPYIPYGKITLVQGDPGIGKSSMVLNLLALASTGEKMPDGKTIPRWSRSTSASRIVLRIPSSLGLKPSEPTAPG
jgi:hypothetical protein